MKIEIKKLNDVESANEIIDDFNHGTKRNDEMSKYLKSKHFIISSKTIEYDPQLLNEIKNHLQRIFLNFDLLLIDGDKKFKNKNYVEKPYIDIRKECDFYGIDCDEMCDFVTVQMIDLINMLL